MSKSPPAELRDAPLGHATTHPDTYDARLLFPVPRAPQRAALGIAGALPFSGIDLWTAYDLTWLDAHGKPAVAIASLAFAVDSPSIVESKSMKLYLGSFAQSRFATIEEVRATLAKDLSTAVSSIVDVSLASPASFGSMELHDLDGDSIDGERIECDAYQVDARLLRSGGDSVSESLRSDLFRSVCPVTGQPDIASVQIDYQGPRIDRGSLLRYLVSFRRHPGFHEHCVERMFVDIVARCGPVALSVYARFTRRGGIDINPFRSNVSGRRASGARTARQ
ncbi:MAG TPA: NADPH-dependent 7-cyano-7-deazaguanine reductase QueF [Casimicrobiaceae bacterium]|nr:NADPH-dependent 7-cyano-7-deazaguanine reductase QueF [Casimicrobiaceae bacterium]